MSFKISKSFEAAKISFGPKLAPLASLPKMSLLGGSTLASEAGVVPLAADERRATRAVRVVAGGGGRGVARTG